MSIDTESTHLRFAGGLLEAELGLQGGEHPPHVIIGVRREEATVHSSVTVLSDIVAVKVVDQ